MIGYGAMLMEGLVGVVALIAAAALPNSMYYDINIDLAQRPEVRRRPSRSMNVDHDGDASRAGRDGENVGESLHGRTGGAVTLAVGMARIFSKAIPGTDWLIKYWYHFAIMFEALFILTTIDTGTRIGRFLVQEFLGKVWKPLGDLDWLPGVAAGDRAWSSSAGRYFIYTGLGGDDLADVRHGQPAPGADRAGDRDDRAGQLGQGRYAPVTLLPMLFVATHDPDGGYYEITGKFWPRIDRCRRRGSRAG